MSNDITSPRWFARVTTLAGNVTRRMVIATDLDAAVIKFHKGLKAGQVLTSVQAGEYSDRDGWMSTGENLI